MGASVHEVPNASRLGKIQVIIAGSSRLTRLAHDRNSPLFNFLEDEGCRLGHFDVNTIAVIVQQPMEDLGFHIHDLSSVSQVLFNETAGQPASVQYICHHAVSELLKAHSSTLNRSIIRSSFKDHHIRVLSPRCSMRAPTPSPGLFCVVLQGLTASGLVFQCQGCSKILNDIECVSTLVL